MDCQMPIVDGFEATKLLRQREATDQESAAPDSHETRHIPIVALTANAMRGDRERCLAAGMDDYITKPIRKDDLKGVLERWISPSVLPQVTYPNDTERRENGTDTEALPVIFDVAATLRNIGGDRALLEDLVELFLQRYEVMLERIRMALAAKDHAAVEQAAHALKGTANNLSASEVVLSAGQLEALGRLGTLVEGPIIYTQLEKAMLRLVHVLEKRSRRQLDDRRPAA
jgi:CheY-like chemotaxis protein